LQPLGVLKPPSGLSAAADNLLAVELDVTNERQAQAAADAALSKFGRIDVLVNNAGRGLVGAVEEASPEEVQSIFAVNVEAFSL
jgi:NAD(P)-dependent dehydrogenase (short-subunit alcohol dehydrogenase family)